MQLRCRSDFSNLLPCATLLSSHWEALWRCFRHLQQWILGHFAPRWDDGHHPQHFSAIISFLHTSLKWLCHLNFLTRFLVGLVTNFFPLMSCLLAFGIRFWPALLHSQHLSAGPPREHCCSALELDTVSTGFSFYSSSIFRSRLNISLTMEDVSQTFLTLTIHGNTHTSLLPDILLGEASSKAICRSAQSFNSH